MTNTNPKVFNTVFSRKLYVVISTAAFKFKHILAISEAKFMIHPKYGSSDQNCSFLTFNIFLL